MNIFASDIDPDISAHNLDDKRVIKMIVESAQILQTALFNNGFKKVILVNPGWFNHPVVKWASDSQYNYEWLLYHLDALLRLYSKIYRRNHAYHNFPCILQLAQGNIPKVPRTDWANCTIYKQHDVIYAYQKHLVYKWKFLDKRKTTWQLREPPDFRQKLWNSVDISDGHGILV